MDDQIGGFEEMALLGQLLDGVAPVPENPLLAGDEGDRALAGGCIHEGGIVAQEAEVLLGHLDLPQIHAPNGPVLDRDLVRLTSAVVRNGQGVFRHRSAPFNRCDCVPRSSRTVPPLMLKYATPTAERNSAQRLSLTAFRFASPPGGRSPSREAECGKRKP